MVDELARLPQARKEQFREWPPKRQRHESEKTIFPNPLIKRAYLATHKCGCTTIRAAFLAFYNKHPMSNGRNSGHSWKEYLSIDKYQGYELVSVWRDPYQRIESTYRWAHTTRKDMTDDEKIMFPHIDRPFADWILDLCQYEVDSWYDMHLKSQMWLNTGPGGEFPDLCIPWNWNKVWNYMRIKPLEDIKNASDKSFQTVWTPAAREAFEATYARDIAFWNDLQE
jgi:hypothetical protein